MGALGEYLASIADYEGLTVPDDMYDSLEGIDAGAQAQIQQLTDTIAELSGQLQKVQAHNYQLLTSGAAEPNSDEEAPAEEEEEDLPSDPDEAFDDMFEDDEDDK